MGDTHQVVRTRRSARTHLTAQQNTATYNGGVGQPTPPFALGDHMSADEEKTGGLTPEQINNIVFAAVDPESTFRRTAAKGLIREFHRRFGDIGLVDLLICLDNMDRFSSLIVLERNEIEEYAFNNYGIFDPDMITKVQFTKAWEDFVHEVIEMSGLASAAAVNEVVVSEREDEDN